MGEHAQKFRGPADSWSYEGSYVVELVPGTDTSMIPSSVCVDGVLIQVPFGSVKPSSWGIKFMDGDNLLFWYGDESIKEIRTGDGGLIWVNDSYR